MSISFLGLIWTCHSLGNMFNTESEININVTGRVKEYNEKIIEGDLQVTESKHDTLLSGYHRVNDIWNHVKQKDLRDTAKSPRKCAHALRLTPL